MTLDEYLEEQMKDPEFAKAWEEIEPELDAMTEAVEEAEIIARDPSAKSYTVDEAFAELPK